MSFFFKWGHWPIWTYITKWITDISCKCRIAQVSPTGKTSSNLSSNHFSNLHKASKTHLEQVLDCVILSIMIKAITLKFNIEEKGLSMSSLGKQGSHSWLWKTKTANKENWNQQGKLKSKCFSSYLISQKGLRAVLRKDYCWHNNNDFLIVFFLFKSLSLVSCGCY